MKFNPVQCKENTSIATSHFYVSVERSYYSTVYYCINVTKPIETKSPNAAVAFEIDFFDVAAPVNAIGASMTCLPIQGQNQ